MAIDISNIGPGQGQTTRIDRNSGQTGKNDSAESRKAGSLSDRVTFTGDAEQLRAMEQAVLEAPGTDTARVESIQAAIEAGTFKVDAEAIADKLLKLEDDLG